VSISLGTTHVVAVLLEEKKPAARPVSPAGGAGTDTDTATGAAAAAAAAAVVEGAMPPLVALLLPLLASMTAARLLCR
jgi:hypothetical protein